ncbi:MAG: glycine cleavage system aminomethyltransferase GcvT [Gemmatimonadetes bacterium]|nr:glycine cleavage system aminomethyltransferase GcvT [Gemmatimonadota bacterium]
MSELKRTSLYDRHVALGGKIVPFAGWSMPVQYPTGILEEHRAVRRSAGLFDVSHMGEIEIHGPDALALIQHITTNDASCIEIGQAQYSVMCREDGGAIDDCIVYRFADRWMIVVNASNRDKDRDWIEAHARGRDVRVRDISDDIGLLALQGPRASEILARLTEHDLDAIGYYHFAEGRVSGVAAVISRTGYTGEDGFELYVAAGDTPGLWDRLLSAGPSGAVLPAGLGARDSLRLEMGYALYGNDLDETRTPLEAGLGWVTKLDKGEFVGRDALVRQKEAGVRERLIGFKLLERGFPRHGYAVRWNGEDAGVVTSGLHAPSLEVGIGMAYVPAEAAKPGTKLEIMIRDRPCAAEVVRPPFYKEGSVRH